MCKLVKIMGAFSACSSVDLTKHFNYQGTQLPPELGRVLPEILKFITILSVTTLGTFPLRDLLDWTTSLVNFQERQSIFIDLRMT
jgi:hypothetical protein